LVQLDGYLDRVGLDTGVLVVFDRCSAAEPITEHTGFSAVAAGAAAVRATWQSGDCAPVGKCMMTDRRHSSSEGAPARSFRQSKIANTPVGSSIRSR
jgi:hypothetical protein